MALIEWLTIAAILSGPVAAVGITLWIEGRRRRRESRVIVLRQLMATRHLPGDPIYSTAVNLIPVEFNDEPEVMAAYKAYQEAIRQHPPADDANATALAVQVLISKQTKMIFAIMHSLGLRASEADLPVEAYAARAMVERDSLHQDSLRATVRIADTLEAQLRLIGASGSAVADKARKG
jgi:hypothetical protein